MSVIHAIEEDGAGAGGRASGADVEDDVDAFRTAVQAFQVLAVDGRAFSLSLRPEITEIRAYSRRVVCSGAEGSSNK